VLQSIGALRVMPAIQPLWDGEFNPPDDQEPMP
jgi:hypothetical protein